MFSLMEKKQYEKLDISALKKCLLHWIDIYHTVNKDIISQYQKYKNSYEYQNSPMKVIQDKLQKYMIDNKYYETAIPLIRKFSKSYDEY